MNAIQVTDAHFKTEVLESDRPTIVDFWAPWCGPCKLIAPLLDETAARYVENLKVTKLNVDENPESSAQFGITSIPTLLFFDDGRVVDRILGAVSKNHLEAHIQRLFSTREGG